MTPLDWMDTKALGGEAPSVDGGGAQEALRELNDAQREAVLHAEGPMLILAGAGSGKTRAITSRIAYLVSTGRAAPGEILAITFTNKAAREMRERVERAMGAQGMWISTFHSMCARILRRDLEGRGPWTRDFTIYDTSDRNLLLRTLTKELGYDTQRFRPQAIGSWISEEKRRRFDRDGAGPASEDGSLDMEVFVRVRDRYAQAMRANNALDFDDLLVETLRLFEAHPGLRDEYARRFRYVLVDEYQDTNRIQYLLVRHLAGHHGNLAVCGDPDQSIYAWRGADIQNILDFEEDFAGGGLTPVRVVKLERNYRSTACILGAAQGLIAHNRGRKEKDLFTDRTTEDRVVVIECADENDEANEIAARIHGLREQGRAPDSIAIFYRVNFMQRALERSLRFSGIPYQIVGGVEFYQRREVRDLVSYLHLLVNPKDDVACRRIVNVPARGIGDRSLERLTQWASARGISLLDAVRSEEARAEIRGRARKSLAAFAGLIERLEDFAGRGAAEALGAVIEETDYLGWLRASSEENAESREENVDELVASAEAFDRENEDAGLAGFLQEVALVSDIDGLQEDEAKVTLMTLHASKGLEFPVVFIAGLEEELLPHALSMRDGGEDDESGIEEERRLMYVGMTRAQDLLFITHAQTRLHFGETSWREPSRFLEEIPKKYLEHSEEREEEDLLGAFEACGAAAELRVGARVEHDHFGYGVIESMQGSGINARVTVRFTTVGTKILLVQYANLRAVGG